MKSVKILYVDDEFLNLISFQYLLKRYFEIFIAKDKDECFQILDSHKIDIIVCDHRMPLITGVELLNLVKDKFPDLKRIILSAYIDDIQIQDGIKKGIVERAIEKPLNVSQIMEIAENKK